MVTVEAPPSVPSQPIGPLEVTSKTMNSITLGWKAPKETGGHPVSGEDLAKLSNSALVHWKINKLHATAGLAYPKVW